MFHGAALNGLCIRVCLVAFEWYMSPGHEQLLHSLILMLP